MEKDTLYKFFAGLASDSEKVAIKSWLEEDAANQQVLLKERAFYDAIMLADEKLCIEEVRPTSGFRILMKRSLKWAAVLLLAFISSYMLLEIQYRTSEAADNTVIVPAGQRVNLFLSDGTKVCLNSGSTFTYPSSFINNIRNVSLDGEAYFEVSANEQRPFVVHTHICDVEVTGTKFNVEAYKDENSFSAALMEGKIKVRDNAEPSNTVRLNPAHKVNFAQGKMLVSDISDYDVYRWKEGLICFKDLGFVELMKRVEKYYGVKTFIENPSLPEHSFSGKFRVSDGIDNLLRVLQKEVGYTYTYSEDGNVIYIK